MGVLQSQSTAKVRTYTLTLTSTTHWPDLQLTCTASSCMLLCSVCCVLCGTQTHPLDGRAAVAVHRKVAHKGVHLAALKVVLAVVQEDLRAAQHALRAPDLLLL